MKKIFAVVFVSMGLLAGCGSSDANCDSLKSTCAKCADSSAKDICTASYDACQLFKDVPGSDTDGCCKTNLDSYSQTCK